jgi:hypothetical protein
VLKHRPALRTRSPATGQRGTGSRSSMTVA